MTEASVGDGGRKQKVVFRCTSSDHWPVAVVGDSPALGEWNVDNALEMQPHERPQGREWSATAELPLGSTIEYKFIKRTDQGVHWEGGFNHRHTVIPGAYALTDTFRE